MTGFRLAATNGHSIDKLCRLKLWMDGGFHSKRLPLKHTDTHNGYGIGIAVPSAKLKQADKIKKRRIIQNA